MKKQMNRVLAVVLAGVMSAGLAGCGGGSSSTTTAAPAAAAPAASTTAAASAAAAPAAADQPKADEGVQAKADEIHIGMVNPLSGDNALYGLDQERGMTLAFEEINAAGGVNGAKLVLDEYDDQGDPQNAAKGAQKFADDDSIAAMVGSSLTSCTLAIVPIIDDAGLVECVVSSSSPSLANCSPYFFRMAVQDVQAARQMAKAVLDQDKKKISVLYANNDFGQKLAESLVDYAKENGGEIIDYIDYNPADQDFTAILTTVKSSAPEAVCLCGTVTDCALLIKQMRNLGIDALVMGHTSLYSDKALEIAGEAMEGVNCVSVYIASNPDPKVQDLVKKFEDKFGQAPDSFAAMAYDMAYVLAAAADRAMQAEDGEVTRDGMQAGMKQTDYDGVTGHVYFTDENEWERDYLTLTVKDGTFVVLE